MPGAAPTPAAGAGLELAPFAAAHFDPARGDLGSLLCPPYDVVEPAEDETLRNRSPHNVVHIVRPRADGWTAGSVPGPARASAAAYQRAADLLGQWRRDGTLHRDRRPALYGYEQVAAGRTQRGILGAVRIRPDDERSVLPHENVFPGPVADRLALMKATEAQLEPILLVSPAATDVTALLGRTTDQPAWIDATAPDGSRHRVWRLGGSGDMGAVASALAGTQALIADGHHRYATYQRLQHERWSEGRGAGPWDYGFALLVGAGDDGLTLAAVHRTVRAARLPEAVDASRLGIEIQPLPGIDAADADALVRLVDGTGGAVGQAAHRLIAVVLSDGRRAALVRLHTRATSGRAAAAATVTAERLIPAFFGATDDDARVAYHHEAAEAIADAIRRRGVAVVLPAPRLADVVALAGAGERMPRKSTSFSPKPRSGLVMRLLD